MQKLSMLVVVVAALAFGACKKSDAPAGATSAGDPPATIASDDDYLKLGVGLSNDMIAAFKADGSDCDKLADDPLQKKIMEALFGPGGKMTTCLVATNSTTVTMYYQPVEAVIAVLVAGRKIPLRRLGVIRQRRLLRLGNRHGVAAVQQRAELRIDLLHV